MCQILKIMFYHFQKKELDSLMKIQLICSSELQLQNENSLIYFIYVEKTIFDNFEQSLKAFFSIEVSERGKNAFVNFSHFWNVLWEIIFTEKGILTFSNEEQ